MSKTESSKECLGMVEKSPEGFFFFKSLSPTKDVLTDPLSKGEDSVRLVMQPKVIIYLMFRESKV